MKPAYKLCITVILTHSLFFMTLKQRGNNKKQAKKVNCGKYALFSWILPQLFIFLKIFIYICNLEQ